MTSLTVGEAIKKVLDQLRTHLGLGETPEGSNSNFIVDWYNKNVAKIGHGPWCEMTISWAMVMGGASALKKPRAYTVYACQDAINHVDGATWHWGTKGMRTGDQVYYNWGNERNTVTVVDHTGMIEKIFGDGTFYVLEGNAFDRLLRLRRDQRNVVGYIRFDWERILSVTPTPTPTPKPPVFHPVDPPVVHPTPKPRPPAQDHLVRHIQTLLEVTSDGEWGPQTDKRARRLRDAARAKCGWPHNSKVVFDVKDVQMVIDVPIDGLWGPSETAHLRLWVVAFQNLVGVRADGQWGPITDNAFLSVRNRNLNNYKH